MDIATQGVRASPYILYEPEYLWDPRTTEIYYSFHHGSFALDAAREGYLGLPLQNFDAAFIAQAKDLTRLAMDAWERVCGVRFVEVEDHPYSQLRIGAQSWIDSDGPFGTLGVTHTWTSGPSGGVMALIVIDQAETWIDPTTLYDVMLHELGHGLGIDHSDVQDVVMSGDPNSPYSDQFGRDVLRPDDIAAAQALFGPSARDLVRTASNGTDGNDTLIGNAGGNAFQGGFGNDVIHGWEGDDTLMGNGQYWTHWNGDYIRKSQRP